MRFSLSFNSNAVSILTQILQLEFNSLARLFSGLLLFLTRMKIPLSSKHSIQLVKKNLLSKIFLIQILLFKQVRFQYLMHKRTIQHAESYFKENLATKVFITCVYIVEVHLEDKCRLVKN